MNPKSLNLAIGDDVKFIIRDAACLHMAIEVEHTPMHHDEADFNFMASIALAAVRWSPGLWPAQPSGYQAALERRRWIRRECQKITMT